MFCLHWLLIILRKRHAFLRSSEANTRLELLGLQITKSRVGDVLSFYVSTIATRTHSVPHNMDALCRQRVCDMTSSEYSWGSGQKCTAISLNIMQHGGSARCLPVSPQNIPRFNRLLSVAYAPWKDAEKVPATMFEH